MTGDYDLRWERWIPFRRASGQVEWLSPFAIGDRWAEDPIVGLAAPRADFEAALLEFLIGLYSVALAPDDEADWAVYAHEPPSSNVLTDALKRLPDAFSLLGDGPRFFQDLDPLEDAAPTPIENLLIDVAGEKSKSDNTDLFIKRDRAAVLGRPAAAMALVTLQTFAPAGGSGHRTSLRGGGPLSTLVEPRSEPGREGLWLLLWANAETNIQAEARSGDRAREWLDADLFPWLAPTRTSNEKLGGRGTTPADAAPAQVYFGLPRRIRLDVSPGPIVCAITEQPDEYGVITYRARNYGVQYTGGWQHPLTPYYQDNDEGFLPVHGQPTGIAWRDWLGLLVDAPDGGRRPAQAVAQFRGRRARDPFRLVVAGYDCDNMKARSWIQAELPAFPQAMIEPMAAFARPATAATELASKVLQTAVKEALLDRPKDSPRAFAQLRTDLWRATQEPFFESIRSLARTAEVDGPALRNGFRQTLRDAALKLFDLACPFDAATNPSHLRKPIAARHNLCMTLEGFGKDGAALFASLELAPRQAERAKSKAPARKVKKEKSA